MRFEAIELAASFGGAAALRPDEAVLTIVTRKGASLFDAKTGALLRPLDLGEAVNDISSSVDIFFTPDGAALVLSLGHRGSWIFGASGESSHHDAGAIALSWDGSLAAWGVGNEVRLGAAFQHQGACSTDHRRSRATARTASQRASVTPPPPMAP